VPLNRPPLALGRGARGVQDARRWLADLCTEIGKPELAECAQLGVSELVTNALLHGEPPITVRMRGTVEHPRVEVRDSSVEAPILPSEPLDRPETDGLLLTSGAG
jgi:anti-sigma regulatory factor (Ser/Thr protein kinase)